MGVKIALPCTSLFLNLHHLPLPSSWLPIHGAYETHLLGVPRRNCWNPGGDLYPSSPSHQASRTCCVSPEPQSFTALCGGVDSRGWAAAADDDEGPVGVRKMCMGDPLIERLILEFGDKGGGEVRCPTEWVGEGNRAVSTPRSPLIQFVSEIRNAVKYLCSCSV